MILVTGGSSSGKSAYAESLLTKTEEGGVCRGDTEARYYIATMRVSDGESRARVEKHRRMRDGKGFRTIEQPVDLIDVLDKIRPEAVSGPGAASESEAASGSERKAGAAALVECISNLTANEMFREDNAWAKGTAPPGEMTDPAPAAEPENPSASADIVADRIVRQVEALDEAFDPLIVVTNNVFEDGIVYDVSTMEYLRALGEINRRLAGRAGRVIEVVAGIPVEIKSL